MQGEKRFIPRPIQYPHILHHLRGRRPIDLGAAFVIVPDAERAAEFFGQRPLAEQAGVLRAWRGRGDRAGSPIPTSSGRPASSHRYGGRPASRQDRVERGRDWPRLQRPHLPGRRPADLAEARPHCAWAAAPADRARRQRGWSRAADRQARCPAGQAHGARRRGPWRSFGSWSGGENSPAIRCAPASPPRHRSMSAAYKSSLGHASAEMTRRYQRQRDRFRVNLTKGRGCKARRLDKARTPLMRWPDGKQPEVPTTLGSDTGIIPWDSRKTRFCLDLRGGRRDRNLSR
jgi:hypothetical protein